MSPTTYSLELLDSLLKFLKNTFDDHYLLREVPQVRSQVQSPKFILRHDVQQDLTRALTVAQRENELCLRGSFLVDLTSPDLGTNLQDTKKILKQIHNLGHEVGLLLPSLDYLYPHQNKLFNLTQLVFDLVQQLEKILEGPVFSLAFPNESFFYPDNSYFLATKVCASSALISRWIISDRQHNLQPQALEQECRHPPEKILQLVLHPEIWRD